MSTSNSVHHDKEKSTKEKLHTGLFGYCYIYFRHDNDDDEEICLSCAVKFYKEYGYLGNCNSQYRAYEGNCSGLCGRCKKEAMTSYWTCCFSQDQNAERCEIDLSSEMNQLNK